MYTFYLNIYTIIIKAILITILKRFSHFVLTKRKERVTDTDHRLLEDYDIKILDFDWPGLPIKSTKNDHYFVEFI